MNTESEARRYYNRLGQLSTVLACIAGFLFWPMMVLWTSGDDLFDLIATSNNIWFSIIVTSIMAATGLFGGLIAIALYKGHEPE